MSLDNAKLAEAINLSDLAAHPAEALAALVEVMKLQEARIIHLEENQMIQAKYYPKAKTMKSNSRLIASQSLKDLVGCIIII